jgi:hypothetical protein
MTPNKLSARGPSALPPPTLHGVWRKDFQSSDMEAMRRAMDAMQLSKFHKMAALKMVNGLAVDISPDAASATVRFLTRVPTPYYSIKESYAKGRETHMGRRDLRAGRQRAVAHALGPRCMSVELKWDGDLPGRVMETFEVDDEGRLVVRGKMEVGGKTYDVRQVYRRED